MNYYDDQKILIATTPAELIIYFQSLGSIAYDVPVSLPCNPLAVIQVKGSVVLPKFLYAGMPIPRNKIYPKLLPSDTLDLTPLCNGATVTNPIVAPDCGTAICIAVNVVAPDCGTPIFESGYDELVTILPFSGGGWALYGDVTSSVTPDGVVTLNVSVINSGITIPTAFTAEPILSISFNASPNNAIFYNSAYHPNMPPSSEINIPVLSTVTYTGDETSVSAAGAVIEIFNIQYNKNN